MQTVEGQEVSPKELEILSPAEKPAFAARPQFVTVGNGAHWSMPLLLLTNTRLIVSKDRIIGRRRADFSVAWSDVEVVSGQLWNGGGPQIELVVRTTHAPVEVIIDPVHAVDVEAAIRTGYLSAR